MAGLLLAGVGSSLAQPTVSAVPVGQRAEVSYTGGLLEVKADGSGLIQIIHDIARKTGMKLTGTIHDERVYGNYGPAAPATILALLLNGTGSNMMLVESTASTPMELILTPRAGGPTPPAPVAPPTAAVSATPTARTASPPPAPTVHGGTSASAAVTPGAIAPPVSTPQEVYDRIQQLKAMQGSAKGPH
jgi:hypothetical protein